MNEKLIEKQAKEIMDKFFSILSKVKEPKAFLSKEEGLRTTSNPSCDPEFRQLFFNIANKKSDDYIVVEKAKWKQ